MLLQIDNRELATILAGVRMWQRIGLLASCPEWDIAANDAEFVPLSLGEIDALCERINCEPSPLVEQLIAALESASEQRGDWLAETELAIRAAYAVGCGPTVSWPLKRLIMAEIDNEEEGGDSPTTLATVLESLKSGYRPYDNFPVESVETELLALIDKYDKPSADRFVTEADWERRAKSV